MALKKKYRIGFTHEFDAPSHWASGVTMIISLPDDANKNMGRENNDSRTSEKQNKQKTRQGKERKNKKMPKLVETEKC